MIGQAYYSLNKSKTSNMKKQNDETSI